MRNHTFVDGNKRAGLLAALVFLDIHDSPLEIPSEDLYILTMGVAEGRLGKDGIAKELERLCRLGETREK